MRFFPSRTDKVLYMLHCDKDFRHKQFSLSICWRISEQSASSCKPFFETAYPVHFLSYDMCCAAKMLYYRFWKIRRNICSLYNLLSHFSDLVLFELWVHLKISLPSCELSFISVFTSAGYNRTKGLKTFLKPKFGALSSSFYYNNILRFVDALSLIKK